MSQSAQEILEELDLLGYRMHRAGKSRADWIALLEVLEADIQSRLEAAREEQRADEE